MISAILKVGDKLEIKVLQQLATQEMEEEKPHILKSMIYDIKSDDILEIAMPTENGKLTLLALGTRYELIFYTQAGMYRCVGQVKERYKSDNLYLVSMELKTNLSKFQRRDFYRLECLLDINYLPITKEEADETSAEVIFSKHLENFPEDNLRRGTVVDISGGGLRLITEEQLAVDDNLLLNFFLSSKDSQYEMWIPGVVLQSGKLNGRLIKYEYRIMFIMKSTKTREQIIKYIFEEERKNRKKEKG